MKREEIIRDIHGLDAELAALEEQYGLLSTDFYHCYRAGELEQTRDFIHVQDVVDANMLVLEQKKANYQAFNVGSGKPTSILEYAAAVCERVDANVNTRLVREYRLGDNRHSVSDIKKLRAFGWSPRRNLVEIFDDFLEWVEMSGGIPKETRSAYAHMKAAGVVVGAMV